MRKPAPAKRRKSAPETSDDPAWLTEALKIYKTQAEFARALNVEPGAVTNWKRRGVPLEQCRDIARVTSIKVARLARPDFFEGMAA